MAKGSADTNKAAVAGMALIRIFLGLFFLAAAAAKLFPYAETAVQETATAPATVTASQPGNTSQQQQTEAQQTPTTLSPQPFIDQLKLATAENGDFTKDCVVAEYGQFLLDVVNPNAPFFGWLIIIGEALVGFFLLIGLFTRLTAFLAMLMSVAYLLATMHLYPPFGLASNAAFLAMEFAAFAGNAGKAAGIDAVLGKKPKKKPTGDD